jgi:O-antigen ligase
MASFFLGGIRLPFGDVLIYFPYAALLAVAAIVLLRRQAVRLRGVWPLLGLTLAVVTSSAILILGGGTGHQIGGLEIVSYAWIGLIAGTAMSIRDGDGIELGGIVLFTLIAIAFFQALQSNAINLSFDLYSLTQPDYGLKGQLVTVFGGSNYLAAFMLFFFAYGVLRPNYRLALVAALGIAMTLSRAAIVIAVMFTMLILADASIRLILPFVSAPWRRTIVIGVVAGLAFAVATSVYGGATAEENVNILTFSHRTILWDKAIQLIAESPLLGYGNGALNVEFGESSAHNWILDVWLSYGIVAAAMFASYLFVAFHGLYSAWRYGTLDKERRNAAGVLAGLGLMAAEGMVEPVLFAIPFVLLVGFVGSPIALTFLQQQKRLPQPSYASM